MMELQIENPIIFRDPKTNDFNPTIPFRIIKRVHKTGILKIWVWEDVSTPGRFFCVHLFAHA